MAQTPQRVFLIDTMAFIFRAYHAMARQRPMSTRSGIPTAAVYVFVNMLKKLLADFQPELIAAIFEGGPTFRDAAAAERKSIQKFDIKTQQFTEKVYAGYKATRQETPPDLIQQIPYIRRAIEGFRIPLLEAEGYEADDVIGTLAKKAADAGYEVFIVSSDKDMLQLVGGKVRVLNPSKDNLICDAAKVEEILGVRPDQVIDVMALRGDAIDNVPGAPGIGDKGSVEIIKRFGDLETALQRAGEVERKTYRESLLGHQDQILWSKHLVTIATDAPILFHPEELHRQQPDMEGLRSLFSELEFTTLLKEFTPSTATEKTHYQEAKSADDIEQLVRSLSQGAALAFAIPYSEDGKKDSEEAEEDPEDQRLGLIHGPASEPVTRCALSARPGEALWMEMDDGKLQKKLVDVLADREIPKCVSDHKSVLRALEPHKIDLNGVRDDVGLYSYLLNPTLSSHRLNEIAVCHFNQQLTGDVAQAADITGRASALLRKEVERADLLPLYEQIDLPLAPVLARMESTGVKIDRMMLAEISARFGSEIDRLAKRIFVLAKTEFNINSPKQLGDVLFNQLMLPKPVKAGKGKTISTAVDVLEELAPQHEIAGLVLEYRQLSKLKGTYVDALPELIDPRTGRLHTTFLATATATGRLSSINPNLQNIPIRTEQGRQIRAAFTAEPGNLLLAADYSQIELRLLAHYSEDPLLTEAFRRGDDIHTLTAAEVFGIPPMVIDAEHRRRAKAVNFGIVYGISPYGLAAQLGIEQKEAKKFIDAYFAKYKGVRRWVDSVLEQARATQKVATLFGRVRPIPDINSKNPNMRGFAERTAINTPLQGTAADLIKLAMIRIDAELTERRLKSRMTLQVHDELVFEVPEKEVDVVRALVVEKMEQVYELRVPLVVDVGTGSNWRDMD